MPWVCSRVQIPQHPKKVHVGQRGNVDVEMDPVELFRLRCLRENDEKFRQGLLNMWASVKEPRVEKTWD